MNPNIARAAAGFINADPADIWGKDLTRGFPWLGREEIHWVVNGDSGESAVLLWDSGTVRLLSGQAEAIGDLVRRYGLGDKLDVDDFDKTALKLFYDPRATLLNDAFWKVISKTPQGWSRGSEPVEALGQNRMNPSRTTLPGGGFEDRARIVQHTGALIETKITYRDDSGGLSFDSSAILPEGSFSYPLEF